MLDLSLCALQMIKSTLNTPYYYPQNLYYYSHSYCLPDIHEFSIFSTDYYSHSPKNPVEMANY